jgi:hypothetical protein
MKGLVIGLIKEEREEGLLGAWSATCGTESMGVQALPTA